MARARRVLDAVLTLATLGGITAGMVTAAALTVTGPAPAPRACYVMSGPAGTETGTSGQHTGTVPSGRTVRMAGGWTFTCTDGTWR